MKRIGVLTSGGDSSGMNACLKNIVVYATQSKFKVFGIKRGYQGLIDGDIKELKIDDVRNISSIGGTVLKTSRCDEFLTEKGRKKCLKTIENNKLDVLIILGGNGTYQGIIELNKMGVKTIAIPATIDNDIGYTEKTLGFDTAVNNCVSSMDKIRETMFSFSRCSVMETMGRNCGDIALTAGVASDADVIVTSENMLTNKQIIGLVKNAISRGVESPLVVVQEHILDIKNLAYEIQNTLDIESKWEIVGYIQRGGSPSVADRILAKNFGVRAIDLVKQNKFNVAIGIKNNEIFEISMEETLNQPHKFNYDLLQTQNNLNS